MNILILLTVKVCDNPEAHFFKTAFCRFILFLCGKIIAPKIIDWFLHSYHICSQSRLDSSYEKLACLLLVRFLSDGLLTMGIPPLRSSRHNYAGVSLPVTQKKEYFIFIEQLF